MWTAFRWRDAVDILLVAALIYRVITLFRGTRRESGAKKLSPMRTVFLTGFGESASVAATGVSASAANTAPETTIRSSNQSFLGGVVAARQAPGGRYRYTFGRSSAPGA